jgi:hypothetical protein
MNKHDRNRASPRRLVAIAEMPAMTPGGMRLSADCNDVFLEPAADIAGAFLIRDGGHIAPMPALRDVPAV